MIRLKVCGTTHIEDALFCDQLKVDFLGFIFHPASKRHIDYAAAQPLIQALQYSKPVGVFVNQNTAEIESVARALNLWGVQIYQPHIFVQPDFEIIQVQRMQGPQDAQALEAYLQAHPQGYGLADTYHEQSYGGTGECFDWQILPSDLSRIFLAGGIHLKHLSEIKKLSPFAIDLVSGVECYPGRKDFSKLAALVEELRI